MSYESLLPVRFLARVNEHDQRTVFGSSLSQISSLCQLPLSQLTSNIVKSMISYTSASEDKIWQESIAYELGRWRNNEMTIEGFSSQEVENIFNFICIS